jgi:hypothetical protein
MTKELYILIKDGGDGSYYPKYTFNRTWIDEMEKLDESGDLEYDHVGCDGDGFHYETLNVPKDCTLESLNISSDCAE